MQFYIPGTLIINSVTSWMMAYFYSVRTNEVYKWARFPVPLDWTHNRLHWGMSNSYLTHQVLACRLVKYGSTSLPNSTHYTILQILLAHQFPFQYISKTMWKTKPIKLSKTKEALVASWNIAPENGLSGLYRMDNDHFRPQSNQWLVSLAQHISTPLEHYRLIVVVVNDSNI